MDDERETIWNTPNVALLTHDELVDLVDGLRARVAELEAQRAQLDCRYAGQHAETSGSHCPLDRPCRRCEYERADSPREILEGACDKLIHAIESPGHGDEWWLPVIECKDELREVLNAGGGE